MEHRSYEVVFNTTFKVAAAIDSQWRWWAKTDFIPLLLNTGCFEEATCLKLLESNDDEDATYAIQFFSISLTSYNRFQKDHLQQLGNIVLKKWGADALWFSTALQTVAL